jgi:hypothetical protein
MNTVAAIFVVSHTTDPFHFIQVKHLALVHHIPKQTPFLLVQGVF